MSASLLNRALLGASVVISLVGVTDAAVGRHWDLLALFVALLVLDVVLIARNSLRRPSVRLRGDLVAWLQQQSDLTGEPLERITDRSVAAYRAGMTGRNDGPTG